LQALARTFFIIYNDWTGVKIMALKNRKKLGNAINLILWNGLDRLHKDTRLDKSVLLDEAIEDLLKKYKRDDLLIEYNKKKKKSNKKAPRQPRRFFYFFMFKYRSSFRM
jgi:hypothetical protein